MRRIFPGSSARAAVAAVVAAVLFTGCEIESPTGDPNAVAEAELIQLFTANQVATFFHQGSELSRLAGTWMQQVQGADRQFTSIDEYIFNEEDGEDVWRVTYRDGGLNEIRAAMALSEAAGRSAFTGVLQIHEAYLMGMAASIWGGVPYGEAVDPAVQQPAVDDQFAVYEAVQARLDEAIANLQTDEGAPSAAVDMNFDGDVDRWIAVAHSLKARFYMHTAEVVGQSAYENALAHASQGVSSAANNWSSVHSTTSTENNLWYQFQRDRSGYIVPNPFMVTMLHERDDPRLDVYFTSVEVDGSGEASAAALGLPATPDFDQPIVSCAETQFIEAEAALALDDEARARAAFAEGLACQESFWGVDLDDASASLTGDALLREIMTQKYIALFLNPEAWNDYKRTCLPALTPTGTTPEGVAEVPPGLYYPASERQTNANIPAIGTSKDGVSNTLRNANDPDSCA